MIWRFIKKTPAANAVHAVGVLFMSLTFFQTDASIMTEHYRGCQPVSRCLEIVEPMAGFEPATSSLPRKCSTPELHRQETRAEDEAQTRDPQLGRLMLYQLSYFRMSPPGFRAVGRAASPFGFRVSLRCVGEDGFEPPKV